MKGKPIYRHFLLLVLALFAMAIAPTHPDTVINATGDPSIDIPALQAAVDAGGEILLRGTFNFGPFGRVNITTDDVTISGEKLGNGDYLTRIEGGGVPFLVGSSLAVSDPDVNDPSEFPFIDNVSYFGDPSALHPVSDVTIKDIHFDNFYGPAIVATATRDSLTITGNKLTHPRGAQPLWLGVWYIQPAIYVGTSPTGTYDPAFVAGTVVIEENIIDGGANVFQSQSQDPDAVEFPPGSGQFYRGATLGIYFSHADAQASINDNVISNVFDVGILLHNKTESVSDLMAASVEGNDISPAGPIGFPYYFGEGIGNSGVEVL